PEFKCYPFSFKKSRVLLCQRVMRFGKYPDKLFLTERFQFDSYGESPLKFGDQIRRLDYVKGAGGNEKNMIGLYRSMFGIYCGALDNRQQVSLDALSRYFGSALTMCPACYFIYLVKENDPGLFRTLAGLCCDLFHINKLICLLLDEHCQGLRNPDLFPFGFLRKKAAEHLLQVDLQFFKSDIGYDPEWHRPFLNFNVHVPGIQFTLFKLDPQALPCFIVALLFLLVRGGPARCSLLWKKE